MKSSAKERVRGFLGEAHVGALNTGRRRQREKQSCLKLRTLDAEAIAKQPQQREKQSCLKSRTIDAKANGCIQLPIEPALSNWCAMAACPHTRAWMWTLRMCCFKAPIVGGSLSLSAICLVNRCLRTQGHHHQDDPRTALAPVYQTYGGE